jgi:hypothetical protein
MTTFLLPTPKSITKNRGVGSLSTHPLNIYIIGKNNNLLFTAQNLKAHLKNILHLDSQIITTIEESDSGINLQIGRTKESYQLDTHDSKIKIIANNEEGVFQGVQTLKQLLTQYGVNIPNFSIKDSPEFALRGFYHDVTRSKVPTLATLKELVVRMASYKLNHLQLYIEHTFAFQNIPELWVDKDPLTAEEILELDEFAAKHFVELVPSLSTFGHLYELLRIPKYEHLNELDIKGSEKSFSLKDRMAHYTLDVSQKESFAVVQKMLKEFIPLFKSKQFNICCDETFDLGKGKNLKLAEKVGSGRLYVDFLKKIMNEVKKYDLTPMFWGDIVLHSPELIKELPKDIIYLNWNYNGNPPEEPSKTFHKNKVTQVMCPGVGGWNHFMNNINNSSFNIQHMTDFARKYKALGILNTDWGDYGHVNMLANSIHGMALGASCSWSSKNPENEYFDTSLSLLEWQDNTGEIASLIRSAGDFNVYNIANCYAWVNKNEFEWQIKKENMVKETNASVYVKNHNALQLIHSKLKKISLSNPHEQDLKEFIWSTRVLIWTQNIALLKKHYEFKQNKKTLIASLEDTITEGYLITNEYEKLWRARNKESELRHTRDIFIGICKKLDGLRKK